MKNKKIAIAVALQQTMIAGGVVLAQGAAPSPVPTLPPGNGDLLPIINSVTTWLLVMAGALAVVFLIIGGVQYVISAGNPTSAEKAKKTIIYALIGIIIIAASAFLVNFVLHLIGAQ